MGKNEIKNTALFLICLFMICNFILFFKELV